MRWPLLVTVILFGALFMGNCYAQEAEPEEKAKKEGYQYSSEGRRDPFMSIIDAAKRSKEEKKKKSKGTMPLEDYDAGQVKLIAILYDINTQYAVVGLPDRKYYTVAVGSQIGIHGGKIIKITPEAVTIREYIPNYKGVLTPEDTVLKLRLEEEE